MVEEERLGMLADGAGAPETLRLTDRDRHLIAHVARVRLLSTEQLGRLAYPGRHEKNLQKRLLVLGGIGKAGAAEPYLRRIPWRDYDGRQQFAWTATERGYLLAQRLCGTEISSPKEELGNEYLDHELQLNELYVQLLHAPLARNLKMVPALAAREGNYDTALVKLKSQVYARATGQAFRWRPADVVRLPWRSYDAHSRAKRDRVILPDAVLEFPGASWRFFLECETGSHSIVAAGDEKQGASLNKLIRYEAFTNSEKLLSPTKSITYYGAEFPDGFAPALLFLVPTRARGASVSSALKAAKRPHWEHPLPYYAATAADAAGMLKEWAAGQGEAALAGPPVTRGLTAKELKLLSSTLGLTVDVMKRLRAQARARQEQPPDYPANINEALQLLGSLKP
ncbi:MAG: replication-relaxation family protein [Myxococcaceae bacterium]